MQIGESLARNARFDAPCLWGQLQNLSFLEVSKQVVMSFCVAGAALCDIPTCLITCRQGQNWRKSRTKCLSCCSHVSRLESLVSLWLRRVYGGSYKTCPFSMFPTLKNWPKSRTMVLPRASSRVSGFPVASPCLWGKLQNLSFWYVSNYEN